ncbi:MAG: GNAT family N-acetyltransferase [Ahniella sp.]|nr:GNAT family N-acetyltransferase [Ahniella sp.]
MLNIRPALASDLGLIRSLIEDLAEYEQLRDHCFATDEALREALFSGTPAAECLIAEWSGQPAGFALFFHNFSTFVSRRGLYLEDLFVRPEFRKHGIGRAVLKHLARLAISRGCARFEWSVLDWNEPAIQFYKALGAKPMSEWTVFRVDGSALTDLAAP